MKLFDNYAEARRRGRGKPQFFAFASFVTMQKFRENASRNKNYQTTSALIGFPNCLHV